ncbi:hypothetical protein ACOJIV_12605 [Haloarcula sp. AONF1]
MDKGKRVVFVTQRYPPDKEGTPHVSVTWRRTSSTPMVCDGADPAADVPALVVRPVRRATIDRIP